MRKRILHISYGALGNGGVTSVILSITESLSSYYDFDCVTFSQTNTRGHIFEKYGKIHYIKCYGQNGLKKIVEFLSRPIVMTYGIYKLCKNERYDIIHCHNGYDMAYCLLGAKLANVPKRIAHSHNAISPQKSNLFKRIYNSVLNRLVNNLSTDRVGCSSIACDALFKNNTSEVIFNSIDLTSYPWKRIPHQGLNIVHVGRYNYQKNQSFIIDVVKCLHDNGVDLRVELIGFGEDERILKQRVEALDLENIIFFIDGRIANIHEAYTKADIMIFPSEYEGFGIVLIEAQATGCYCFASDVVPRDTNIGMIDFLPLNMGVKAWADRISNYWGSNHVHSYESIKTVLNKYDNKTISKQYQQLYEK